MKGLAISLVALVALLLAADRVAAEVASRAIASQVQTSTGVSSEVEVDIEGFPFLTQALEGRYDRVEVRASDVPAGEVRLARLDATLTGVRVGLSDALSGSVERVPVDSVQARALLPYAELARRSGDRSLSVAPSGDRVRVTGRVEVLGQTLSAVAVSRVELDGAAVVVTAESYEVGNGLADSLLTRALGGKLDIEVPVTGLPYGLKVTGLEVQPEGVTVRASATSTVLSPG